MTELFETLAATVAAHLPAAARVAGMVSVAPVFSFAHVPAPVRCALVVGLAATVCTVTTPATPSEGPTGSYMLLALGEALIGLTIGIGARLLLEAFGFAGQLLDMQVGFHAAALYDPASGHQTGLLGQVYGLTAVVLFLQVGGHHWLIDGLAGSFAAVPPGQFAFSHGTWPLLGTLGTGIMRMALQVAAPVTLVMLLVDMAFGVIARTMPQMNVFLVAIPAKILVGLVFIIASLPLLLAVTTALVADMNQLIWAFLHGSGG